MNYLLHALLLAAAPASASPPPAAAPAPQRGLIASVDFAARPLISRPSLSPSGGWVLAMLATPGTPSLGLIAVAGKEIRTFAVPKGFEIVSYRWAGDGRVLVSVGKNTPWIGGEDVYATRLIAYDVATRKSTFIGRPDEGPKGDDILWVAADGGALLLAIQRTIYDYPSVFRVDLATGAMKEVVHQRDDVWDWYADGSGVVRAGVGYDKDKWSLVYRRGEAAPFRKAGKARYDDRKASLGLLRFALDSDQGYILSNEKTGRDALYRFNYQTLELGDLVYQSATNDVSDYALERDAQN